MSNRKRQRKVMMPPPMEGFKPFGMPMRNLEPAILLYEEFEALRLADYKGLNQEKAAVKMDISRLTFTRIYDNARKTIAKAFVAGKAIHIRGGTFTADDFWFRCCNCKETMITLKPMRVCRNCHSSNIIRLNNSIPGQQSGEAQC